MIVDGRGRHVGGHKCWGDLVERSGVCSSEVLEIKFF